MSVAREAGSGAATDRVTRTMALALGVGALIFGLLVIGDIVTQSAIFAPWWTWGTAVFTFLSLLVGAATSSLAPAWLLRAFATVSAVGHLCGLVLLVPALGTARIESGTPWLLAVSTIATSAAAFAWRAWLAWPYLAVCVIGLGVDRIASSSHTESWMTLVAVQDAVYALLFDAVFAALALATRRAGRTLDRAADLAVAEVRSSAAAGARVRERSRIEALLHDNVLVALLASARGSDSAADEARAALDRLDRVANPPARDSVTGGSWLDSLRALTTDLAPSARFSHEAEADIELPAEVAEAVLEATTEAVRNSVRHAGPASRAVHARLGPHEVEVTVLDDGVGFAPETIRGARLGVSVSILERMRMLTGGRADVVSRPTVGTRVVIGWRAP